MKNNIIEQKDINTHNNFLGAKTINLKKCSDWGFPVPDFIALPSHLSKRLFEDTAFRKEVAREITQSLKCDLYAVRSSALIEDGARTSYAGQFQTELPVSQNDLDQALYSVLSQAHTFLHGRLELFSLLIQKYIPADLSGITFTRNPNGNREMILEYGLCKGENLVSGTIHPKKISLSWNDPLPKDAPRSFAKNSLKELFQKLEIQNGFPQDIEWCITNDTFYLLQTRPITTISETQYQQILFLEKNLPKDKKYFFEKTEISEIAPRPSTLTQNLLNRIYADDGPVNTVYKKYAVRYNDTHFLKIIGNELYVDKEKEIQGILPSYSYLKNKDFIPKITLSKKIFQTIRNIFSLNLIPSNTGDKLFSRLAKNIKSETSEDLKTALTKFLDDYSLIFEINLLTGIAVKKATRLLQKEPVSFSHILNGSSLFINLAKYQITPPNSLRGNSLEFLDDSSFKATSLSENKEDSHVIAWWKTVPEYKKKLLKNSFAEAILLHRMREFGRWLTLKNKTVLQKTVFAYAKEKNFQDLKNILFASFENILNNTLQESTCLENKKIYESFSRFSLPKILTSSPISSTSKILGISSGNAIGTLQNEEFLASSAPKEEKYLLYTETLSPDLAPYLDNISGILSNNGGLLSHLAILAREQNIPVIVGFSLHESPFQLGDRLSMNGDTGIIEKI